MKGVVLLKSEPTNVSIEAKRLQQRVSGGHETSEWMRSARVPAGVVTVFTRQLALMLSSGIPLDAALEALRAQATHPTMAEVCYTLHDLILQGVSLSEALERFPRVFPSVFHPVVQIAEKSGTLVANLMQLAEWTEREHRLQRRVLAAISYPLLVLALGLLITLSLFIWVLPPFLEMMQSIGVSLPLTTRGLLLLSEVLRTPGFWLAAAALLGLFYSDPPPLARRGFWRLLLRLPVLSRLVQRALLTRYVFALQALVEAGCDAPTTWRLAARCSGNPYLMGDSLRLVQCVCEGQTPSQAMKDRAPLYGGLLIRFVTAAEESGRFSQLYRNLRRLLEDELEHNLEVASRSLEPLLLGGVGVGLATWLLSIFTPLYAHLSKL